MLILAGVPIGNPGDVTLRVLEALRNCDLLLCEDRKTASRLFRVCEIPFPSDRFELLNEHTTGEELSELVQKIQGEVKAVLISDAGMPVICDPGAQLVERARRKQIPVQVLPGVTALTTALGLAGVGGHGFHFLGYPPRETGERIRFFKDLAKKEEVIVFYETPYRARKVLRELNQYLPKEKKVFVGAGLTTDMETVLVERAGNLSRFADSFPSLPPVFIVYHESRT